MHDDDTIRRSANKASRIAVTIYVIVKQIFYMSLFESIYWVPRTYASIIILLLTYGVTSIKPLSKRHIAWLFPVSVSIVEIILVASFGGDRMTYIFLIGCALLSLMYMDVTGLLITAVSTCTAAALCIFVFGYTLVGEAYDFSDDVFNFAGLVIVDFTIFLIGKYGIGALAKSKQDVEDALLSAQRASKAKSDFLATMSHEIRTPLNAILGITQLQLQEENIPDKYAHAFENIHTSGTGLLSIINDILDLSKIETGNLEIIPAQYDVPSFINDTIQLNAVRVGSKPIEFIIDIDENLPQALCGDELRLKQILSNLLSNAVKYTEKGHVKLSVYSNPCKEPGEGQKQQQTQDAESGVDLFFRVEDTGQGMTAGDLKLLFTEYVRFNADANRTTEGTGLGLNITKRLITLMNGDITVESEYRKGSVFTVFVPQKVSDPTPIGKDTAARLNSFAYIDSKAKDNRIITCSPMPYGSVLLVDDVESNILVAKGLLSRYGLNIETTDSGFKAIALIEGGAVYDIVFMDHMMPIMDGIEATQKIRALGYNGTVIALTANALTGNSTLFSEHGFDDFISKPIDIRLLDSILNKYIRDKYPEKAKQYEQEHVIKPEAQNTGVDMEILRVVASEAKRAIPTLRETSVNGDIKLFTTTAHAMKSALLNAGLPEPSKAALELEKAGRGNDIEFIKANIDGFIELLEDTIEKLQSSMPAVLDAENSGSGVSENTELVHRELETVRKACEEYNIDEALESLSRLRKLPMKKDTADAAVDIYDALYLDSDFEKAIEIIDRMLT